jgi:hypothetical protein
MKKSLGFRNLSHKRQGIALVTVLILLVLMVTLVSVTSLLALSNRRSIADTITTAQAQYAAEAGVEMALKRVYWDPYTTWKASADALVFNTSTADPADYVDFDTCAYKKWLTGIGFGASDTDLDANNSASCPYVNFSTAATGAPFPGLKNNSKVNLSSSDSGAIALQQGVYDISIERQDSPTGDINLSMRSVGLVKDSAGNTIAQRVLSRTLKIAGDPYEGDRYAMLTTAANCSFCHLQIDTRQRALSTTGTFDRARIGFTSTDTQLDFAEKAGADVVVYGGMYIRADLSKVSTHGWAAGKFARYAQQKDGKTKAGKNSDLVAGSTDATLNGSGDYAFDTSTGSSFYTNNVWDARKLFGATATATTDPKGGANRANGVFYHNYPTKVQVDDPTGVYKGKWPDGALPDEFPAAIPDGGDGQVSDADWTAFVGSAPTGRVEGTNVSASGTTTPVFYGVRRPSSVNVNAAVPWVYNPIVANGITNAVAVGTAANLQNNPTNYLQWWITQALASPNNRDFLPTTPGATANNNPAAPNQLPFNINANNNAYQNNFYVNYNPTGTGSLTMAYCSGDPYNAAYNPAAAGGAARANLQQCARGQYTSTLPTFVNTGNGNSLRSVTIPNIGNNVWFPQTSNTAMNDLMSGTYSGRAGYFDGNLIIDAGTLSGGRRPAQLTGTILVNGDLVIRGKVLGSGRIVARGNIYIVGDLVYSCDTVGTLCTKAQYAAGTNLPKLALLAGGNIIVGDYDAPDSRMDNLNRAFDLTNDQTGRNQVPNAATAWDYWNVPGSTGRPARRGSPTAAINDQYATLNATNNLNNVNPNGATVNFDGHAGFLTRSLEEPNSRASNKQVFKVSPFGYILGPAGSAEKYENGNVNNFINGAGVVTAATLSKNISSLYPTNGPFKIGDRLGTGTTNGLVSAAGYPTALGCGNPVIMPVRRYMFSSVASGLSSNPDASVGQVPTANLNFSFWCAPAGLTGTSFIRRNGTTTTAALPNAQPDAWMRVNARDEAVDSNTGLTTGWLGGVLTDQVGNPVRGDLSQTRLLKLMWLSSMESGRTQGPLRTDGIFYSANSMANLLRSGQDARPGTQSSTQSRWIHIGSVIASELGFLTTASAGSDTSGMDFSVNKNALMDFSAATGAPASTNGTWGTGFAILYDDRLQGFLQVTNTNRVKIRRTGIYAQVGVTR